MRTLLFHIIFCLFTVGSLSAQAVSHTLCANDARVKRYFVSNPEPGMVYNWSISGGGQVLGTNSDTLYVDWGSVPGIYEVYLLGSLGGNCQADSVIYRVEVLPLPQLQITGNLPVCAGEKLTLQANGVTSVLWSNGETTAEASFFPTGNQTVWAVGSNGVCASDTAFALITVAPEPVAAFSANPLSGEAPLSVSFFNGSSNAQSYFWNFGNGAISTAENPIALYTAPGEYPVMLRVQNQAGCADSLLYNFIVVSEAFAWFVPNTFTANGDNLNEFFRPLFPVPVTYTLSIFDRWGNLLYDETSIDASWNGIYDGKQVPQGIYQYRLQFRHPNTQKSIEKIGHITLIR